MPITRRRFLGATAGVGASVALPSTAMAAAADGSAKAATAGAEYQAARAVEVDAFMRVPRSRPR